MRWSVHFRNFVFVLKLSNFQRLRNPDDIYYMLRTRAGPKSSTLVFPVYPVYYSYILVFPVYPVYCTAKSSSY